MIVLACEESGAIRDLLIDKGYNAISCDTKEGRGKHIIRHYTGDIFEFLDSIGYHNIDLLIGHPPCTSIAVSGNRYYTGTQARLDGIEFFRNLWELPIKRICLENPVSVVSTAICKPTQYIQPWQFGHGETKKTGLWLKNLPKLLSTNIVTGRDDRIHKMAPSPLRAQMRSETYSGIAQAMVDQWAPLTLGE